MRRVTEGKLGVTTWWDSPAEFAADCARELPRQDDEHWTGETWDGTVRRAREGRLDLVAGAEAVLERISANVETPRTAWDRARAGAYPVVPEALAGHPDPMRRRVPACDTRAPLRVWVELTSSARVPAADLVRRGTAFLALAMVLSAERAVEMWAVTSLGTRGRSGPTAHCAVRLPTQPIDLAVACNALASPGFARSLGYTWMQTVNGTGGGWAWGVSPDHEWSRAQYVRLLRASLGAEDGDLVVPPAYTGDPALKDPVTFVQRAIDDYTKREE